MHWVIELKKQHSLLYKPFPYFADFEDTENSHGHAKLAHISSLIKDQQYDAARESAAELIRNALAGIRYLETYVESLGGKPLLITWKSRYDRLLIRAIVVIAYVGWIVYSAIHIIPPEYMQPLVGANTVALNIAAIVVLLAVWSLFALQHSAGTLYLYVLFPVYFWHQTISRTGGSFSDLANCMAQNTLSKLFAKISLGALVVIALQSMVVRLTVCSPSY